MRQRSPFPTFSRFAGDAHRPITSNPAVRASRPPGRDSSKGTEPHRNPLWWLAGPPLIRVGPAEGVTLLAPLGPTEESPYRRKGFADPSLLPMRVQTALSPHLRGASDVLDATTRHFPSEHADRDILAGHSPDESCRSAGWW